MAAYRGDSSRNYIPRIRTSPAMSGDVVARGGESCDDMATAEACRSGDE